VTAEPSDQPRLTDSVGLGVLTSLVPRDLVDDVLGMTRKTEQRNRLLPARVVVYWVLALTLFYGDAYEEVMRKLVGGLRFLRSWRSDWTVPTTGAMARARARLGEEPMAELFSRVAQPIAGPGSPRAWYRGLRVMAIDGVVLDVPDTPSNAEEFGRSVNHLAESPFPQVRVVGLAECGSRAVLDAAMGPLADYERALLRKILPSFQPEMLVLADRGFFAFDLWNEARSSGAQLLWRVVKSLDLPVLEGLPDGSYRSQLLPKDLKADLRKGYRARAVAEQAVPVRVIEYSIPNRGGDQAVIRLVTSLLDPEQAPAIELAELYQQRWEFELALDEIQTHQLGRPRVLRSKSPEMVRQEIWALLITHYAIRHLMWQAADDVEDLDVDRVSFTRTLRLVRRHTTDQAGLSPLDPAPETP